MLFPKGEERASKPPLGEREEIPGKNLQESLNPGATIFGAKGNCNDFEISNSTRQGGSKILNSNVKFKFEISSVGGVRYLRSKKLNYSKRDHFSSNPKKCIGQLPFR